MLLITIPTVLLATFVWAHDSQEKAPTDHIITFHSPGSTFSWHALLQVCAWAILFPVGLVLGLVKSRWYFSVQTLGSVVAMIGHTLGYMHRERGSGSSAHATFSPWLIVLLATQWAIDIYLKLKFERGLATRPRRWIANAQTVLAGLIPIAGWAQLLLGLIAYQGFCQGEHMGQCLAHLIMGSAFIAYGIVLAILLVNAPHWMERTGRSQEFWDSCVIAAWGCLNTFIEHHWGDAWNKTDTQHTVIGVIWWAAGVVGIWLSRDRQGRPQRNLIPSLVIIITGWAMSGHAQHLKLSTQVHAYFGYTLMAAGVTRIIEISLILRNRLPDVNGEEDESEVNSFQYLPVFLLCASGFILIGATEEQMAVVAATGITHVSYLRILYSISLLFFLFVLVLLHLYSINQPTIGAEYSRAIAAFSRLQADSVRDVDEEWS